MKKAVVLLFAAVLTAASADSAPPLSVAVFVRNAHEETPNVFSLDIFGKDSGLPREEAVAALGPAIAGCLAERDIPACLPSSPPPEGLAFATTFPVPSPDSGEADAAKAAGTALRVDAIALVGVVGTGIVHAFAQDGCITEYTLNTTLRVLAASNGLPCVERDIWAPGAEGPERIRGVAQQVAEAIAEFALP
jgi:hypothetical protein